MLYNSNFVLDLTNITFQIMRKAIIIAMIAVLVTVTIAVWLINSERPLNIEGSLMIPIQIVILVFAIFVVVKRWRSAKEKLPAEDEMSKKILRRGAATSYYVSLYLWIALMYFEGVHYKKNIIDAYAWINISLANLPDNKDNLKTRNNIENKMDMNQIKKAQIRTRELIKKYNLLKK